MAEHAEKPDASSDDVDRARSDVDWAQVKDRFVGILAGLVRWVCLIFALILVLHIIFVVAEANAKNGIVDFIGSTADNLTLGMGDIFQPEDPKTQVLVNYGIAAVVWLIISAVGAAIIRRVGGAAAK